MCANFFYSKKAQIFILSQTHLMDKRLYIQFKFCGPTTKYMDDDDDDENNNDDEGGFNL